MADKKGRRGVTGIGISSLIIVFVVLAVTVFSLLTLLTVRQDLDSARQSAEKQQMYYAADILVTEKLAKLKNICGDDEIFNKTAAAEELGFTVKQGGRGVTVFSLRQEIDSSGDILLTAEYSENSLTVTEYRTVSNNYYVNDNSLPVWDGGSLPFEREE